MFDKTGIKIVKYTIWEFETIYSSLLKFNIENNKKINCHWQIISYWFYKYCEKHLFKITFNWYVICGILEDNTKLLINKHNFDYFKKYEKIVKLLFWLPIFFMEIIEKKIQYTEMCRLPTPQLHNISFYWLDNYQKSINVDLLLSLDKNNEYIKNALDIYLQSYIHEDDLYVKYLLLVAALECLLNLKTDKIAHTIAKHVSILRILWRDIDNIWFDNSYGEIKKLYSIRSKIIHWTKIDQNTLDTNILLLQKMTALSIIESIKINKNKKELFEYLNKLQFK